MRRSPLRRTRKPVPPDPAREAWKRPRYGRCASCGLLSDRPLHGHHAVDRQTIRRNGGDEWDPRWRIDLDADCHLSHEFGLENRKLSRAVIPEAAVEAAAELMGEELAMLYFIRHYREVG